MAYQACVLVGIYTVFTWPRLALTAVLLRLAVPTWVVSAAVNVMCLPELLRWSCGWLQDAFRRDMCITYEPAGRVGSFQASGDQTYLFLCHPTGTVRVQYQTWRQDTPTVHGRQPSACIAACNALSESATAA
jgi:hypothetical protein